VNGNHTNTYKLASLQNKTSRLGRPDARELDDKERKIIINLTKTPKLNILDLGGSEALKLGRTHNSWCSHPWISNDLLLLFFFNTNPEEHGLKASLAGLFALLMPGTFFPNRSFSKGITLCLMNFGLLLIWEQTLVPTFVASVQRELIDIFPD